MKICLVGYVDNTPENQEMLDVDKRGKAIGI